MAGELGTAVSLCGLANQLVQCVPEPIRRQFSYLFSCFDNNVQFLQNEAAKLEAEKHGVQMEVDTARNNAQIVAGHVISWLAEVSKIQTKKREIDVEIDTTRNGGRFGCRYSVSKKVMELAEDMKVLRDEFISFKNIANPPPTEATVPINIGSTIVFDSRKRVENEIMASLRDKGTNMVGICGMGGVGKSTMAKTIMQRAREELGFEETVMAVVSQKVEEVKIQVDIAKSFGLTLSAERSLSYQLRTKLSAGTRRVLVVIDDVWEKLELEELGIPCNISGCRVLITSRDSHVLKTMDVKKPHVVQVLSKKEAWELFKRNAGSCIEQQNVVGVATQVVDECKGLPIALVTVGLALRDSPYIYRWNSALRQLRSSNPTHLSKVIKDVYQPLKLSYDSLETEDHKTLFLLCCLFPEDCYIHCRTLANISMGLLELNEDITNSRDTIFSLIDNLKNQFLLLQGYNEDHVKMHDVVRDVAIFIAAEEMRVKCKECTWISPNIGERIGAHGGSTQFPYLRLLWIDSESRYEELEIHNDFSDGMRELKVIMITCRSMQRLPETIGLLKNLRTLVLEDCESLESISAVGELFNLEILICRSCRTIESLPAEIGSLRKLRLLELSQCYKLQTIAPGIISNLRELEELIVEYFDRWEARIVEGERKNAPLCELRSLSKLTCLKIKIRDYGLAAENFNLPPSLLKFHIIIGDCNYIFNSSWDKIMELKLEGDISWGNWFRQCVRSAEYMNITGDGSSDLDLQLAAPKLRHLIIKKCSTVKKLQVAHCPLLEHLRLEEVSELEEIASNFNNLSSIRIEECSRLHTLFSMSAKDSGDCFPQLKRLKISNCAVMEQVLMWKEEEQNQTNIIHIPPLQIRFPKLNFMQLDKLRRLTCFIKGMQGIEFPQLDEMRIDGCPELEELVRGGLPADNDPLHFSCDHPHKVKFGKLSKLRIYYEGRKFCLHTPTGSFTRLTRLAVCGLKDLKSLFSFSMTESSCLSQLEELDIRLCDMMEQVILWKEEEENQTDSHRVTLFPKLKSLSLRYMPRLKSLTKGIENIIFHVPYTLDALEIMNCPILESCASEIADDTHLLCNPHHKVEFDQMKEQRILGPSQIPMLGLFRGVCRLYVSKLKGMGSLFPCLIAQMMHNITELHIKECQEMVVVIEDKVDASDTTPPILLFPHLEQLHMSQLPVLRSFCEWRCGLELPSLLNLDIAKCDMMVELTSGPLNTPNLHTINLENHKLNGIDVSSPLRLSSLRKQAEKEKHNLNGKDVSSPLQLSTRLRKTVEKRANVDEIPAEIEGIANNRALFNVNAMLDQTEKYTGSFTKARVLREVGSSSETPKLTPDSPISKSIEEEVRIGDIVVKTIKELLEDEESGEFWILATIDNITQIGGDSYLACNACYKELTQEEARKLMCGKCESIDIAAKLRHKIEVKVDDGTATTNFLIWVKEGMELIGKSVGKDGVVNKLPREINNLQNMKAFFEVNVLPNQKGPFTVLQATNNEEMINSMIYSIKARKSILEKGKMVKEDTYQEVDENTSVDLTDDDSQ